jgi:dolichol-phosphate mannosyltransferase
MNDAPLVESELKLLSVVIPARNEEGCIVSTVEHLHTELRLQKVPHEIIVVDDGAPIRPGRFWRSCRPGSPTC